MKPLVWIVAYGERDIKDATATTEARCAVEETYDYIERQLQALL